MLEMHTQTHGYTEVYVPYIVNAASLTGTGQLPKFAADLFRLEGDQEYYLAPTAEVPVTNIARDKIYDSAELGDEDCATLRILRVLEARRVVTAETLAV